MGNYCLDTRRLPNKTNRNVLASKLRPVKSLKKKSKISKKKKKKLCIVEIFFQKSNVFFFHLLGLCTNFQSSRFNNKKLFSKADRSPSWGRSLSWVHQLTKLWIKDYCKWLTLMILFCCVCLWCVPLGVSDCVSRMHLSVCTNNLFVFPLTRCTLAHTFFAIHSPATRFYTLPLPHHTRNCEKYFSLLCSYLLSLSVISLIVVRLVLNSFVVMQNKFCSQSSNTNGFSFMFFYAFLHPGMHIAFES